MITRRRRRNESARARPRAPPEEPIEAATAQPRRRALTKDAFAVYFALVPLVAAGQLWLFGLDDGAWLQLLAVVSLLAAGTNLWRGRRAFGTGAEIGYFVLTAAVIFWFYLPGVMTAFSDDQWHQAAARISIENPDALPGYVAVGVFYAMVVLTYQIASPRRLADRAARLLGANPIEDPRRAVMMLAVAAGGALAFYVMASGGLGEALSNITGSRTVAKPWDSKGNYGTSMSPFHVVASSVLVAVTAYASHLLISERRLRLADRVVLGVAGLLTFLAVTLESGTRSTLIQCVAPAALLFYRRSAEQRLDRRLTQGFLLLAVALFALAAANYQLMLRSTGSGGDEVDITIRHNDFLTETAFALKIGERHGELTYDSPLLHIVTGPFPRFLWKGKPEIRAVAVHSMYMWGVDIDEKGGNTLPSIVGQYYLSWGWFGVFEIGFWLGLIFRVGDSAFVRLPRGSPGRLGWAVFVIWIFVAFRTIGFFFFMPVALTVLGGHLLSRPRRRRRGRASAVGPIVSGAPGAGPGAP